MMILGVDCLAASLYEQLSDSYTGEAIGLLIRCQNCEVNLRPRVGQL